MTSVSDGYQFSLFRFFLGFSVLLIFSTVALFAIDGEAHMQKDNPNAYPSIGWDAWFWFFILLPFYIIGLSIWIMGIVPLGRSTFRRLKHQ